jgi:nucleoside-diphosphate kinase
LERTFLAIKPDGVQRGLVGEIIGRFEAKGFTLVGMKLITASRELAEQHYAVHKERPFFAGLVDFITSGPMVAMVWEGDGVVASARKMIGATNPLNSEPGTIRGDLAVNVGRNIIHGSDAVETANQEISLWFKPEELSAWTPCLSPWTVE